MKTMVMVLTDGDHLPFCQNERLFLRPHWILGE